MLDLRHGLFRGAPRPAMARGKPFALGRSNCFGYLRPRGVRQNLRGLWAKAHADAPSFQRMPGTAFDRNSFSGDSFALKLARAYFAREPAADPRPRTRPS